MKITMETKIVMNTVLKSDKNRKLQIAMEVEQYLNNIGIIIIEGKEVLLRFHIEDVNIN